MSLQEELESSTKTHPITTLAFGKGSLRFKKSAVFLNIVQKAFDPPPFISPAGALVVVTV